jgi:DNA-binding PadR family transcriptional regulator
MYSKQLLKGTLKTIILKLLEENGQMYGYEMTQHVKDMTEGQLVLTEAALYPSLHKLEAEGLLTTEKVKVNNRTRKYYKLTTTGEVETTNKLKEFEEFMKVMQLVLSPKLSH